jgi:hypothetical protein
MPFVMAAHWHEEKILTWLVEVAGTVSSDLNAR